MLSSHDDLRRWVESEIKRVESIAVEANDREYVCRNLDILRSLKKRVSSWDSWWKIVMISLLGGVILLSSYLWTYEGRISGVEARLDSVDSSVQSLTEQVSDVKVSIVKVPNNKDLLKGIKTAVKEAFIEAESGFKGGSSNDRN